MARPPSTLVRAPTSSSSPKVPMAPRTSQSDKTAEIRALAEADLETFIRLVAPKQCMGSVHSELCDWWQRQDAKRFQLTLLPRDHQKSRMVAFRVAHAITKDPTVRILYIS